MPLQEVAREAGRPARLISKQLLEAYGQLRCGLRLEYYTLAELLDILQQQCGRLGGITTLELANILDEQHRLFRATDLQQPHLQQQLQAVLTSIQAAFQSLRSLDLRGESYGTRVNYTIADIALLAPLGSCLTALKLGMAEQVADVAVAPPALGQLTYLRRLSVSIHSHNNLDGISTKYVGQCLEALACMPALVQLDLQSEGWTPLSAQLWLPGLTQSTPQLTSVALGDVGGWDAAALSVLHGGLTALKSLSLSLVDSDDDLPVLGAVLPALAGRKGLTSLSLGCTLETWELPQPVPASLQLADWTLDVSCHQGQQTVEWLLEALPCQTALTSLVVHLPDGGAGAEVLHSSLLAMPPSLVRLQLGRGRPRLDAASLMEGISRQRGLTELRLAQADVRVWAQEAGAKLAAMTQLQVVTLAGCRISCGFLEVVAAMTWLRRLELDHEGGAYDGQLTDAALLRLHPLQQLTRLQLLCPDCVLGPGLAVVQQLGALQELDVRLTDAVLLTLHQWLLPLPLKLRKLTLLCGNYFNAATASDALLDAAKQHGCTVLAWGPFSRMVHKP
jgi:hypothetical protein